MLTGLAILGLFALKALVLIILALLFIVAVVIIIAKAKGSGKERLVIHHLNEKLDETREALLSETLSKDDLKQFLKDKKSKLKAEKKNPPKKSKIYVLQFIGDLQASAVNSLREEVTALLTVATPQDEVVVKVDSGGGMVHAYGLCASQLKRIRDQGIPLTVCVDKIAASGGYLMAAVANRIFAAPFAIIGSIGVVFQLPNFHRALVDKHIEYELITAGDYKRTLTMFGKNTEEGREKLREELEDIHQQFKDVIQDYRKDVDIQKVATGEHWLGAKALELKLVDKLITSDDYLSQKSDSAQIYEISYETKKSWVSKFKSAALQLWESKILEPLLPRS